MPTSSPQITTMFGRWPDGAGCAWARATLVVELPPSAEAAANVVLPSKILRRSSLGFSVLLLSCMSLLLIAFPKERVIPGGAGGRPPHPGLLGSHRVLQMADEGGQDRPAPPAAARLADQRADIAPAAGGARQRGN